MTTFSELLAQDRLKRYRTYYGAEFYRTVHLMKTILGIDPLDERNRDLIGNHFSHNHPTSGLVEVEMPTGPLWLREENGKLVVDLHEEYGGSEKSYVVTSLDDIAKVVKQYPPYGWHYGEDDGEEHEYTTEECLICTPRGEEVC